MLNISQSGVRILPDTAHFICMLPSGSIQLSSADLLSCGCTLNPTVAHVNKNTHSKLLIQLVPLRPEYAVRFKHFDTCPLHTTSPVEQVLPSMELVLLGVEMKTVPLCCHLLSLITNMLQY